MPEDTPHTLVCVCGKVCDAGDANAQKLMLKAAGDGSCPSKPEMPLEDLTVAPLVIPVSVPVMAVNSQAGSEVGGDCVPQAF